MPSLPSTFWGPAEATLTRDVSRKGWRYKLQTDANHRFRRRPEVRNPVEAFRRNSPARDRYCHSTATSPHKGPLQVHHVGGIKRDPGRQRFTWLCMRHNMRAAGYAGWFRQTARSATARAVGLVGRVEEVTRRARAFWRARVKTRRASRDR